MAFFICSNCGFGSASWLGKCPDCGQFNTLVRQSEEKKGRSVATEKLTLTPLKKIQPLTRGRIKTGIFEFDRVLGAGFVPGEVILLSGEPGVGKSTLILQTLQHLKTVYISGEEAAEQVKDRAERLKINFDNFLFSDDLQIEGIIEGINDLDAKPDVLVVDSVQTVYSKTVDAPPGNITQLRECTNQLTSFAKKSKTVVILIGHITKGGDIAGPKTLEHAVDCVLDFEGERVSQFRILHASKNRFGGTDEIGIFEMKEAGLREVSNPLVFLEDRQDVAGKAIVGVTEGKRPLFFEVQTLTVPTALAFPRRIVKGVDYNKTLLLLAVVKKYLYTPLDKFDVYVNVVGGVTIRSPLSDLGIIASLLSSVKNMPLPKGSIFMGEVGLLGEIRHGYDENRLIKEAQRLKFNKIFSPQSVSNIRQLRALMKF